MEDFELRYAAFRGLNLTFEVREGIIKHSHDYDAAAHPELAEYLLDQRPPLEAQLIDLTDEVAYNTADLDDGYESHILTVEKIRAGLPLFARCFDDAQRLYPDAIEKLQFNEALRRMLNRMVTDLITNTQRRITASGVQTLEDVRRHPERLAAFSAEVDEERRQAKQFLYRNLYYSEELVERKEHGEEVVLELFAHWLAHPEDLPRTYQEKAQTEAEPLARIVCDYVAGMTDHFILEQHKKYCGLKCQRRRKSLRALRLHSDRRYRNRRRLTTGSSLFWFSLDFASADAEGIDWTVGLVGAFSAQRVCHSVDFLRENSFCYECVLLQRRSFGSREVETNPYFACSSRSPASDFPASTCTIFVIA